MKYKQTFHKTWEILKPFLFYYVLHSAVFVLLLSLCQAAAEGLGTAYLADLTEHADTVTGVVSGVSMIISVLPFLPMLRRELAGHRASAGEVQEQNRVREAGMTEGCSRRDGFGRTCVSEGDARQFGSRKEGAVTTVDTGRTIGLTVLLAVSSSLGLNVLLTLTGLVGSSASYQEVAGRQYGVAFGIGILLYALVSPVTEEIIFRGLVYNRMRRYMPCAVAVVVSGVLFGVYHGNPVQGLYGGCMGILMAYLYERTHSFFTPCLFHAAANLTVYVSVQNAALQGVLFTVPVCIALFVISGVGIMLVEVTFRTHANNQPV